MSNSEGMIFNIQKFCISDGSGIRTTVFFKGCPLDCAWCHNPESKSTKPELSYSAELCRKCRRCAALCPHTCHLFDGEIHLFRRDHCVACGSCVNPACHALSLLGRKVSVDEVMTEVMKDKPFYDHSGGGLTLSGGEPMLQFDFAYALLQSAKQQGLHTCMETCGYADSAHFKQIAPLVDIFLYDYKLTDVALHKHYTGVDNRLIVSNLCLLDSLGAKVILRCPIIPGVNDTDMHFRGIAETANNLKNVIEIQIEPYHSLGENKTKNIGKVYEMPAIPFSKDEIVSRWIESIQSNTNKAVNKA